MKSGVNSVGLCASIIAKKKRRILTAIPEAKL
jgi:hypothetical protein